MTPHRQSHAHIVYALIGLGIALSLAGATFLSTTPATMAPPPLESDPAISLDTAPSEPNDNPETKPNSQGIAAPDLTTQDSGSSTTSNPPQGLPAQEAPDESIKDDAPPPPMPRTSLIINFPKGKLPPGDIQGVGARGDGLALTSPKTSANPRRVGTFTSDAIPLNFPTNAIAPLWKAEIPEGTTLEIALSLSPDGKTWLPFRHTPEDIDSAQAISPTYPDGRPNPFYGYTPGGMMTFGLSLFSHVRYRANLYSEVDKSPRLTGLKLYYQDTTLGRGHVATLPTPP